MSKDSFHLEGSEVKAISGGSKQLQELDTKVIFVGGY